MSHVFPCQQLGVWQFVRVERLLSLAGFGMSDDQG